MVVLVRSYSRTSGSTSLERNTFTPGRRVRRASPMIRSWPGLRKEKSRQTATASTWWASRKDTSGSNSSTARGVVTCPWASTRSVTSRRMCRGTSIWGDGWNISYSSARACRRISSTSRNPRVVNSAVRAPLDSRMALVTTVVA